MLFSEPKIPQSSCVRCGSSALPSFSALQRAENSSITVERPRERDDQRVSVLFSEPKIPQFAAGRLDDARSASFSALQRAENSSMQYAADAGAGADAFQCSSASRKFLNSKINVSYSPPLMSFSALQRAENSSMNRSATARWR